MGLLDRDLGRGGPNQTTASCESGSNMQRGTLEGRHALRSTLSIPFWSYFGYGGRHQSRKLGTEEWEVQWLCHLMEKGTKCCRHRTVLSAYP
jgi:hypothetical protein